MSTPVKYLLCKDEYIPEFSADSTLFWSARLSKFCVDVKDATFYKDLWEVPLRMHKQHTCMISGALRTDEYILQVDAKGIATRL